MAITSSLHSNSTGYNNHVPHTWEYADAAARTGATGFAAEDVGKWCLQLDTDEFYRLTAVTPTWAIVAGGGGALSDHDHSGDVGDGGTFDAANLTSGESGDGDVLTSDGAGGAAWETPPAGGGGGMTEITFRPYQNEPPAAAYATLDTRNGHPTLDFDAATDESAIFTGVLPYGYAGGGLTVYLHITDTNDTNAAHASYWDVAFEALAAQDTDSDGFAAAQSSHVHPSGTSGVPVICTIAFTDGAQMDSVAAGGLFRIKVTRDADNDSDDWANDAELIAVHIRETP